MGLAYNFAPKTVLRAAYGIFYDEFQSILYNSITQLMNKRPTDVESQEKDPAIDKLQDALEHLDWVERARVRIREDGDVLTGEAFLVPRDERDLLQRLDQARGVAHSVDWRLHDISMVPVRSLR